MSFQLLSARAVVEVGAPGLGSRSSVGRRPSRAPVSAGRPIVALPGDRYASQNTDMDFLPFVAHELRNSLAVVRSAAHLLGVENITGATIASSRTVIERHVQQMARLIDKLLTASQVPVDRTDLALKRIDLRIVVARAVQSLELTALQRRQSLTASSPAEPTWVVGDATRLEQVFVNLLSNASKYTDAGGEVRVSMSREQGEVVVRVLDTGIGIDPQLLPHVFDLFVRAPTSDRQIPEGSGVGLALVRVLVNGHGGSASATSAGTGTGSEFTVRLPLAPAARGATDHLAAFRGSGLV
jgi:signal transduction histidine kinase